MTDLKPCPFCGGDALSIEQLDAETYNIECNKCYASGGYFGGNEGRLPPPAAIIGSRSKLNPGWIEALMGYPIGWTDLEA